MQESRLSSEYPLSISSCCIVCSSESNIVLEKMVTTELQLAAEGCLQISAGNCNKNLLAQNAH